MKNKIKCAKELNKVLGVSPALPTDDSVSESVMDKKLKKAAGMLTETEIEELSEVSVKVLTALGCDGFEAAEESEKEEEKEEEKETPAPKKGKAKKEEPAEEEPADDDKEDEKPVKGKKVAMKEEKETPAAKVKNGKKKTSRMESAVAAISKKKGKKAEISELIESTDIIHEENGGNSNPKESSWAIKVAIQVMEAMGLISKEGTRIVISQW